MDKKLRVGLILGGSLALVGAAVAGMIVSTTRPSYQYNNIILTPIADQTALKAKEGKSAECTATVDGKSLHGGKPELEWKLVMVSVKYTGDDHTYFEQPAWLSINHVKNDDTKAYIQWTADCVAGIYSMITYCYTWHSAAVTTLTIT